MSGNNPMTRKRQKKHRKERDGAVKQKTEERQCETNSLRYSPYGEYHFFTGHAHPRIDTIRERKLSAPASLHRRTEERNSASTDAPAVVAGTSPTIPFKTDAKPTDKATNVQADRKESFARISHPYVRRPFPRPSLVNTWWNPGVDTVRITAWANRPDAT